jgi:1-acyl-sn-glycerol-3-phosphate acyltransferase
MNKRSVLWKSVQAAARVLSTLLFDLKVYGRRNVPRRGGVLIVCNHQGNLDPVLFGVMLDRPLHYFAKSELFEHPFYDWLLRALNALPVRQGAGDVTAVKESIRRLRQGVVLNIYPEGSRSPDGAIGPLEKGVALIMKRAGVPVVPAVIDGSFDAWPIHRRAPRPWPVRLEYGPPMHLAGLSSDEILDRLNSTLRGMLAELSVRSARRPRHQRGMRP